MLKKLFLMLLLITTVATNAQILSPVKWTFTSRKTAPGEAELVMTAAIESHWHVYSQLVDEGGPVPTSFRFRSSSDYELIGKVKEVSPVIKAYENVFGMEIAYFANEAVFVQKVRLKKSQVKIKGSLEYMTCNDQQCLPPEDVDFAINVKDDSFTATSKNDIENQNQHTAQKAEKDSNKISDLEHDSVGLAANNIDTISASETIQSQDVISQLPDTKDGDGHTSLWAIFIAGFLGGLAAFLMPCIFPMVPFTVSFFTKSAAKGNGVKRVIIYSLSIIVIYVALGLLVSVIFGADALNNLSTNGIFNFVFFLLLVAFAASFLGAFELTLPSKWVNKTDAKSEKNGLIGIFFMAATLVLVSFSCTGPIIGTLLVQAATMGEFLGPAVGMFGFALALSIPFTLFALFPAWLQSLPKSGGWLNSIKVVLGFLELALALKFLSNVDLAYHWDWFDREIFLALWITISGLLGLYLLGKIRLPNDSEVKKVSVFRMFLAIITLSFTMYMIPGLWGAPLRSIAAFLPPQQTQDFDLYTNSLGNGNSTKVHKQHKYGDIFHAPLNLDAYFDYNEGMAYAKKVNKPVMVDFTGHACVNCRKMEADVWSTKQVLDILSNKYVLIQLYVDDKTELPEEEQYVSEFSGKRINTIGKKWSDLQASKYNANSQPFYVLLSNEGELLAKPQGADYNPDNFAKYLNSVLIDLKQ